MEANEKLCSLFGKKNIKLVESGDHSILSTLQYVKSIGKSKVLIQDQGGWMTYKDYVKKVGLELIELKTDYGIVDLGDLKERADDKSVLLVNSLNGYFSEQPMEEITRICSDKNCTVINDASGSVGTELSSFGEVILCSFGKDKPINLHYGGCIAYDDGGFTGEFDSKKIDKLNEELDRLFFRLQRWNEINRKIKKDLKEFDIIHRDKHGINVIVKFSNDAEKKKVVDYCKSNEYEYTLCPRYIRVMEKAVSIEVKRKNFPKL